MSRLPYPDVISEDETIDIALNGRSLARYGDGELKLILGGNCVSQLFDKDLAKELADILKNPLGPAFPCIPNVRKTVKPNWESYAKPEYTKLYKMDGTYGSSFITRPDSAPWIDRADYWAKVRKLWDGKDVTLVIGTERSLRPDALPGARSVKTVWGPRRDAYKDLPKIQEEIGLPTGPILLCLGPAATVLANRLAKKQLWGIDVGHIGMFMRHAGMYAFGNEDLVSLTYKQMVTKLHGDKRWGVDGHRHADDVLKLYKEVKAETCLDYGCGEQTLAKALEGSIRVQGYDPGIPGRDGMPKPCDVVACTDVLEHVEPSKLNNVLKHIYNTAGKAAYFVISLREAREILPDGRNAHLIVEDSDWWRTKLTEAGFVIDREIIKPGNVAKFWCYK